MFSATRSSPLRHALIRAALCSALALPSLSGAAALGDANVRSFLGQRLDAEIEFAALSPSEADSLTVRIAPADLFAEAGVDYTAIVRSVQVAVERRGERSLVRVTSDLPVNDPFVTLLIEISTNGSRLVRQYALLIDPPAVETPAGRATAELPLPSAPAVEPAAPVPPEAAGTAPSTAASPASPASAPPAVTTQSPDKILVRKGQSMAAIGATVQPEGVRLEQVLVALQNANPGAFIGRNINRVRSGSVLTVPDAEAMRAVDPTEARRTLRVQTADFLRYQKSLAERAASRADAASAASEPAPGNRSSGGQVGVQVAEPRASASPQDKLTLSAPGASDASSSGPNAADALDKIAADKALADANARIAALEKSIGDMQQLLALQSKGMADAQQRAAEPVTPAETDAGKTMEADQAADPPAAQPEAAPAEAATPAPQPAPKAMPAAPAAVADGLDAASGTLHDPRLWAGAAGFLLVPLLGWLAWRRRRRLGSELPPASDTTVAQTVIAEAGGRHVDTAHSAFQSNFVPSVSQIDANEVDAVAEADVYIAYGRDAQAEEILLDALREHPERHALRLKLLEIYAARKDKLKFGTLAAELRVLTHGQGEDWAQASRLGQLFDPGNRLFGTPVRPETPPSGPVNALEVPSSVSPVADFQLKLEGLLDERRRDQPPASPAMAEAPAPGPLDFSLSGIATPRAEAPSDRIEPRLDGRPNAAALNTKLDLAIACQEIGDKEGARELLAEVAAAHDPELSPRAQSLLKQLA